MSEKLYELFLLLDHTYHIDRHIFQNYTINENTINTSLSLSLSRTVWPKENAGRVKRKQALADMPRPGLLKTAEEVIRVLSLLLSLLSVVVVVVVVVFILTVIN